MFCNKGGAALFLQRPTLVEKPGYSSLADSYVKNGGLRDREECVRLALVYVRFSDSGFVLYGV